MRLLPLFRFALSLVASAGFAHASMQDAVIGAQMLSDIAEARVIRLDARHETQGAAGRADRPSEPVYGVLFRFEGYTWFYAAEHGTRVVAPFDDRWLDPGTLAGRLESTGIPAPSVTVYSRATTPAAQPGQSSLANACVIASLAILQQRVALDRPTGEPGLVLLSYHIPDAARATGFIVDHAVLVFRDPDGWKCIDPRKPDEEVRLSGIEIGMPVDSALMELALRRRYPLRSARLLALQRSTIDHITRATLWRAARPQLDPSP